MDRLTEKDQIQSIIDMASSMVQIPSRGGEDGPGEIIDYVRTWLAVHGIDACILKTSDSRQVGVASTLNPQLQGRSLCLVACIDTSSFGYPASWNNSPTSGMVSDGKLHGRGSADSKIAAAIFAHIMYALSLDRDSIDGTLHCLFDADEHTGAFGGVKTFLSALGQRPTAAAVGYPGNYGIVIGARGFLRAIIHVYGIAAHSGSKSKKGVNAIRKALALVEALEGSSLPEESDPFFEFGPTITVTGIDGGGGFSQIPDHCSCNVDIRLTPSFTKEEGISLLEQAIREIDITIKTPRQSEIEVLESWPAYRLDPEEPIVKAFTGAASKALKRNVRPVVCGPSNVGNLLNVSGIPTICGFGVSYKQVHASNEYADLALLPEIYQVYLEAIKYFLS